jgi:hypothetical protein
MDKNIDYLKIRGSSSVRKADGEVTLNTITDVGHINKARIHVDRGLVQRIVILEVQQ